MTDSGAVKRAGRPPGADPDATRVRILEAAIDAFAERGFDGASIREITSAAGVGHNLARHYFGSKEDLWRAAVQHGLGPAAEKLSALLEQGTGRGQPEETLRATTEALITEVAQNPKAIRLMVTEALAGGPRFDEIWSDILAPLGVLLTQFLGGRDRSAGTPDPRVLGLFVFGAMLAAPSSDGFTAKLGLRIDESVEGQEAARTLATLVLHGLRGTG